MIVMRGGAVLLLVCTAAVAAPLPAASGTALAVPTFESLDRNGDRRLSRTEAGYNRLLSAIFVSSDTDGDGFVSRAEYEAATGNAELMGGIRQRI